MPCLEQGQKNIKFQVDIVGNNQGDDYLIILQNMLFRAPGKTNNFDYASNVHFQSVNENNQRPVGSFNNSFTVLQKCSSQEKVSRNYDQRYTNYPNPGLVLKTQPQMIFDDEKYKQNVVFKPPPHPEMSRTYINYNNLPPQQQCLILRKEKSQFSQKMRRAEQQIQAKENLIRGKQKEIEQLKLIHTQSQNSKPRDDTVAELRSEKQKLYFQVIDLQTEIHKIQQKYEKMQRQHYGLSQKYDELSNKSSLEMNRKISKEQLLQSELSLSQKRNQRLKTEYEKQINNLKEKIRQNQNESKLYNNKSTVLSYNQSSFSDNFNSTKSQPELENSRIEIEKYQSQIKQKNQMIRYLEMQCLRDRKKDPPEQDFSKINSLYEQCKKQLTKTLKQGDAMKRQIGNLMIKCTNSEKIREDLFKQVKDLQYLLKQVRDKLCKTMEENRTINKRQRENNQKLGERIQQLQSQLLKSSSKFRQEMEETQKSFEKMLNDLREKSNIQMKAKDEQIKQYSIQKQQLLLKMTEYQSLIKENSSLGTKYEQLSVQFKEISNQKLVAQSKFAEDLDHNIQRLQKQLKIKTDELFISDSTIIALEKQINALKKSLENKTSEISTILLNSQEEKRKYAEEMKKMMQERNILQEQKRIVSAQKEEFKRQFQAKSLREKDQDEKKQQIKSKEIELKYKKEQERYENLISYLRDEQRKLRNMIGDQERDNLNLTISLQNQKQKHFDTCQKLKSIKQDKKNLKKQAQDLKKKIAQLEEAVPKTQIIKQLQNEKLLLADQNKKMSLELQKLTSVIDQMQKTKQKSDEVNKSLKIENERMAAEFQQRFEKVADKQRLNEEGQSQKKRLIEERNNLNTQMTALIQKFNQKDQQILQIKPRLLKQDRQIQKLVQNNQRLQEQNKILSQLNEKYAEEQGKKQLKLFQMQSQFAQFQVKLENITQAAEESKKYSSELEIQIKTLQENSNKMQQEIKAKVDQIKNGKLELEQLKRNIQEKEGQIIKMADFAKVQKNNIIEKETQIQKLRPLSMQKGLFEVRISELQTQVNNLQGELKSHLQVIQNLNRIIKQRQSVESEQRKSLQQKSQYNRQIEQSLQQLTRQLEEIKLKFLEVENQKAKSPIVVVEEEQKGLMVSKNSGLSQSFIADFIEIDKNALLHICDLLGIEPQQGEILRTIIQVIETSNYQTINEYYREILQLFGVETDINQKTQEVLIGQIKSFRETLMSLVEKVSLLELRNDNLSKDNHRLNKQLGKIEFKDARANQICGILDVLNDELIKTKLSVLNTKVKTEHNLQQVSC